MNWAKLFEDSLAELTFMEWALMGGVLFFVLLLAYAQFRPDQFDIRHVFVNPETGKIDRWALFATGGALFMTWGFVKLLFDGKGDWWLLLIYGLLMMFPKVVEQVAGPLIRQRFGAASPPPCEENKE